MRALRPWRNPRHRAFYVPVDSTQQAFQDFIDALGDLTDLLDEGGYVLVTGDTGCGKSALVNRCADWVVNRARAEGCAGLVVDLTRTLAGQLALSIEGRLAEVSDRLLAALIDRDALKPGAADQLLPDREVPHRVLPRIGGALRDGLVLIVLLPSPNDLKDEVIRYTTGMLSGKVLFVAESAGFTRQEVEQIMRRTENGVAPISLKVGYLTEGDVKLFVADRIGRWETDGAYPRMSPEALELVERWAGTVGVGFLQRLLYETYEFRRRGGQYGEDDLVTADEVFHQAARALRG